MGDYIPTHTEKPSDLKDRMTALTTSISDGLGHSSLILPKEQRAIVTPELAEKLQARLSTIAVRDPNPGEAIVSLEYSGICRSDISFSKTSDPKICRRNHIAGHEGLGRIVTAHDTSLLGRHVAIRYLGVACRTCTYCLENLPTSCPYMLNIPNDIPGTFQEYITVPLTALTFLPNGLLDGAVNPSLYAAALCSGSTALTALKAARPGAGDVVAVVGIAGAIGHLTGALARHVFGARVVGIDLGEKIDAMGETSDHYADLLLHAPSKYDEESLSRYFSGVTDAAMELRQTPGVRRAAQCVIVSASTTEAFKNLDRYVCDGGRIVCVGVPPSTAVSIPINALVERNITLSGNLMGRHEEAIEVMGYIQSKQIVPCVTEVALEDVPKQMQALLDCRTTGKLVIKMNNVSCVLEGI